MERNFNIPITFAILDEVQGKDTRFLKIVIDVLHTGKNFNGSIFDEDVVNDAIPSIKNTPILGYILVDDDGDTDDFAAHEYKIVKQSEGYKYMYDGSAYGVIPESCNPRWINKVCDDGKLRKFYRLTHCFGPNLSALLKFSSVTLLKDKAWSFPMILKESKIQTVHSHLQNSSLMDAVSCQRQIQKFSLQ